MRLTGAEIVKGYNHEIRISIRDKYIQFEKYEKIIDASGFQTWSSVV